MNVIRRKFVVIESKGKQLAVLLIFLSFWNIGRILSIYRSMLPDTTSREKNEILPMTPTLANLNINHSSIIISHNTTANNLINNHPNFTFYFPLCLVHVGKAAGSSLSCGLGLMYADCEGMPRNPPLPHTYYFHMKKDTCRRNTNTTATYLMPIRNPITRIESWFNFEKGIIPIRQNKQVEERFRWKRGMLFIDCYTNFVDLVVYGLSPSQLSNASIKAERPINMTCPERAWAAILGVRDFSYHEWYNYEYYWTALQRHHTDLFNQKIEATFSTSSKRASLLVLRTEHLAEDWSKISKEELFRPVNQGSRKEFVDGKTTTSVTGRRNSDFVLGNVSITFWNHLCHAMCPEIQIYKQILYHADNLNTSQIQESIIDIQRMCPNETLQERICPDIPKFPLMKVPKRQYRTEIKQRLFTIA